ncbi:hypothetical protein BDV38DRAFT_240417 [Aspergillus pseudotamarii]|uniref:Secreted protein n=1 Tax=Aspergillus pseudotamarii TaxID=132259 RepID=A0A5N6T251_ASPPS|nr:uncharacterized protein BDV38DRAFT_240417 [Aspergillus pseudotamarii]KAE8140360.1 hypothetical protein BDV38DRAFT_240417 [Aspergillus pseudotamarii]
MASAGRVVLCLTCLVPSKVLEDSPREAPCPPRLIPGLGGLLRDRSPTPLFLLLGLESPGLRKRETRVRRVCLGLARMHGTCALEQPWHCGCRSHLTFLAWHRSH